MSKDVTTLIFSKDRAYQLDALLRSMYFYRTCLSYSLPNTVVLYKATTAQDVEQYNTLKNTYPIDFMEEQDFTEQLISQIMLRPYIMFLVDDTLFYHPYSVSDVKCYLELQKEAIGFSFRLGANTSYCYMKNRLQPVPEQYKGLDMEKDFFCSYNWANEDGDFGYPLEVSSSMYRSEVILYLLKSMGSSKFNPSTFESFLHNHRALLHVRYPKLLSYPRSVAFSAPVNLTKTGKNPCGRTFPCTTQELKDAFDRGKRFGETHNLQFLPIVGAHQEIQLL
jgi:hypothetical protein